MNNQKMKNVSCWKEGYPRPQFVRNEWVNLNGEWDFLFDKNGEGMEKKYYLGFSSDKTIIVPFAYETPSSGIGEQALCESIWYQKTITLNKKSCEKTFLHLEGSDYFTTVFVNGVDCGSRSGGYHRLTFDVSAMIKQGENLIVICVKDDYSKEKPRGKQRSEDHDYGCWYLDTTGIYKTVWLETVSDRYVSEVKITPDVENKTVGMDFIVEGIDPAKEAAYIQTEIFYGGKRVALNKINVTENKCGQNVYLAENQPLHLWNAGQPELYDVVFTLFCNDEQTDKVESYFGMRQISCENGKILLNGRPLYQKLVLDQGYWQQSGLTPINEKALEDDITEMLAMGFNGARKHQKVEDERYLYYADIYGFIVWAEMPSMYNCTKKAREVFSTKWMEAVKQQYNHPCVLVWVPFNESWGIENVLTDKTQQLFTCDVYNMTKKYDPMRPVITNDGWEHTISDILTIHHYTQNAEELRGYFDSVEKCIARKYGGHDRGAFADGYKYNGQPIMITEFGGTSFVKDTGSERWGYGQGVKNEEEFLQRYSSLVGAIKANSFICGYCYTQISDVYNEVNGLMNFSRVPKVSATDIKAVNDK